MNVDRAIDTVSTVLRETAARERHMSKVMKAIRVHRWCVPDEMAFEEIPAPESAPGEVRVRVACASPRVGIQALRFSP